ncbi:ribokinase [Saccharospirillum impatiens]|uniref:ribokinase n=1 Tax=Saccharospirillum impatiens TaxID=169438 RepID=UPI00041B1191|nr:ribokinase [Saccharospirillum impatiens]
MTLYNLGSINIDHLYQVDHFVRPGETLSSTDYQTVLGGKGANQSIALARAGAEVRHLGALGQQDDWALAQLQEAGVNTDHITLLNQASGHAIIQLTTAAENAIILYPGANHCVTDAHLQQALATAGSGDWLLMQNETNGLEAAVAQARKQGLTLAFNPAPMDVQRVRPLLGQIDWLIVNEIEAMDLTETRTVAAAEAALVKTYPQLHILLTLGKAGVVYLHQNLRDSVAAHSVEAVDTTAAGDTFIGYALSALATGQSPKQAMALGTAAAAICVTRLGASSSIPTLAETQAFISKNAHSPKDGDPA